MRGIAIIEYLAESEQPQTLSEIATMLSIPKSSALDLLHTLIQSEIIIYDNPSFKTYKLGIKLFTLGATSKTKNKLGNICKPYLLNLREKTGKTIYLAVPHDIYLIYIDKLESRSPIQSTAHIGSTNPLYLTGLGKAILATYSNEKVQHMLKETVFEKRTPYTINNIRNLIEDLTQTRARGYAIDNREGVEYIHCFAAPILDFGNQTVAAISIMSIINEIGDKETKEYPLLLTETALAISQNLGYKRKELYVEH